MQEVKRHLERAFVGDVVLKWDDRYGAMENWWWDILAEYFTA